MYYTATGDIRPQWRYNPIFNTCMYKDFEPVLF